jgi:NADPH2:quinone reductase
MKETLMRATYYERNGSAREVLQFGEIDTPTPGPGEVRVRLKTSGVNPSDVKARQGTIRKIAFPRVVPQSDGAGVVDAIGDGVPSSRLGERVWTWSGQWKRPFGTGAEYIVLPAAQAVTLPDAISFEVGACLGIPALTAHHAVALSGIGKGVTVLISGGAGAVAHYAIQFAKMRGATVLTTVSSDAKAKLARDAGADHVIDYKREDVGDRVAQLTGKRGVDSILEMDLTANAELIPAVVRQHGNVVVYGTGFEANIPAGFCLICGITLKFFLIYEIAKAERDAAITEITGLLTQGRLVHNVARRFPLEDSIAAHEAVEAGMVPGNVVLLID